MNLCPEVAVGGFFHFFRPWRRRYNNMNVNYNTIFHRGYEKGGIVLCQMTNVQVGNINRFFSILRVGITMVTKNNRNCINRVRSNLSFIVGIR